MAHLEVLTTCPDYNHEKFKSAINEMRYYSEGTHYQGYHRPVISEMRYYDIRIRKEFVEQFCADAKIRCSYHGKHQEEHRQVQYDSFMIKWFDRLRRLVWKLTPIKGVTPAPKQKYSIKEWHYSFLLGKVNDGLVESKMSGRKRECL